VLDDLRRQQLMVQEAQDADLRNSKEVKDALEDFKKTLLVQEMASRLTKDVIATEEDARNYYKENKDKFVEPVTWHVSEIVTSDETSAKNTLVQVLQGGDFSQIAKAQSKADNASTGGKLKPFLSGRAPFEAMQNAIATLEEGGVSSVFKGPNGYYIVKVDSKTGGAAKSFADVKKDLIYGLTMQKQQKIILSHLNELAEKYKPEYNKELIEQVIGKAKQAE
ncbi:MAG: peptidyl-prolyl cis-trans isomerase, partial [Candidatus Omnitrophica bacterium]|nr:peptidyl-prolyl cis-trans isomerase [Candidatus Omnitrophota bacterium]